MKLSFHVIQQLILHLKASRLFSGCQFALKLAALPQRSAHVHPHAASMCPKAHSWSNPPTTFRWRVRLPHHDDIVSSQNCLGLWTSPNSTFNAITNRHLSMSFHCSFTNLTRLLETCVRSSKVVDGIRCVNIVAGHVRKKTMSDPEHSLHRRIT